jgi:hypothetical protein
VTIVMLSAGPSQGLKTRRAEAALLHALAPRKQLERARCPEHPGKSEEIESHFDQAASKLITVKPGVVAVATEGQTMMGSDAILARVDGSRIRLACVRIYWFAALAILDHLSFSDTFARASRPLA